MKQSVTDRRMTRLLGRAIARAAHRPDRVTRRRNRGQTLIIFVMLFTALIAFIGLAIDTARVYDLYARMERAAEAGALAGVIYMPAYYSAALPTSPYDNAICRALQETSKNGFGTYCDPTTITPIPATPCPTPHSSIEVAVCPVNNAPHELEVDVTEHIDLAFLSTLGVGALTLTVPAIADYTPPVDIGVDPTNPGGTGTYGTFGSCGTAASSSCAFGTRNWAANINGPGELKEQGDPLVTCQEGLEGLNPANKNGTIDAYANSPTSPTPYTTYTGLPTNHPQYSATLGSVQSTCTNPDTKNAFTGPTYPGGSTRPGYAYLVYVPPNATENLWVWNAPFSPSSGNSCNGRTGGQSQTSYDVFYFWNCSGSSHYPYYYYPGTSCSSSVYSPSMPDNNPYTCNDPYLYFAVSYTIIPIEGVSNPLTAIGPVVTFTALPYEVGDFSKVNGCSADYQPHSTFGSFAGYTPSTGNCVTSPCIVQWCPMPTASTIGDAGALSATPAPLTGAPPTTANPKGGSYYRVMVVAADYGDPTDLNAGWGGHSYSLRLCPTGTTQSGVAKCAPAKDSMIAGWKMTDALFSFPGNGGGSGTSQTTEYPLGFISGNYAGETLDFQLYDEGDLNGTNGSAKGATIYAVAPPLASGASTTDPCGITSSDLALAGFSTSSYYFPYNERSVTYAKGPLSGIEGSNNGDLIYNGLWTSIQVTLPGTYTGGEWTLCAMAPQTNDGDVLGIQVQSLAASPVHLTGS